MIVLLIKSKCNKKCAWWLKYSGLSRCTSIIISSFWLLYRKSCSLRQFALITHHVLTSVKRSFTVVCRCIFSSKWAKMRHFAWENNRFVSAAVANKKHFYHFCITPQMPYSAPICTDIRHHFPCVFSVFLSQFCRNWAK